MYLLVEAEEYEGDLCENKGSLYLHSGLSWAVAKADKQISKAFVVSEYRDLATNQLYSGITGPSKLCVPNILT